MQGYEFSDMGDLHKLPLFIVPGSRLLARIEETPLPRSCSFLEQAYHIGMRVADQ